MKAPKSLLQKRVNKALHLALQHANMEREDRHTILSPKPEWNMWVIDQMVRVLAGDDYNELIEKIKDHGFEWDGGSRPGAKLPIGD